MGNGAWSADSPNDRLHRMIVPDFLSIHPSHLWHCKTDLWNLQRFVSIWYFVHINRRLFHLIATKNTSISLFAALLINTYNYHKIASLRADKILHSLTHKLTIYKLFKLILAAFPSLGLSGRRKFPWVADNYIEGTHALPRPTVITYKVVTKLYNFIKLLCSPEIWNGFPKFITTLEADTIL